MHGSPVHQKNGEQSVMILQNLNFVPNLLVNLFSISKALKNGFNLGSEDVAMKLMKEDTTVGERLYVDISSIKGDAMED